MLVPGVQQRGSCIHTRVNSFSNSFPILLDCYRILSRIPSPFNFIVFCFCHPHQAVYAVHGQDLIRLCLFSA